MKKTKSKNVTKPRKNTSKKSSKSKIKTKPKKPGDRTVGSMVIEHANKTGVRPLGSRVLIKPYTKEELQEKNEFGIILPEKNTKEKSEQGIVLAVGPGEYQDGDLIPMTVKVGDKVAFSKYGYEEINVKGEEYFLIKEDAVLAILS